MVVDHVHRCTIEHSIMRAVTKMYLYHDYLIYIYIYILLTDGQKA